MLSLRAKIRIDDKQVRKLIEITMSSGKETMLSLKEEKFHQLFSPYLDKPQAVDRISPELKFVLVINLLL